MAESSALEDIGDATGSVAVTAKEELR
jgi:precorrin-6B methylase 2